MGRMQDLWREHDELVERAKKGEDVQREIDEILRKIQEERERSDLEWSERDLKMILDQEADKGDLQPGQNLPKKRR